MEGHSHSILCTQEKAAVGQTSEQDLPASQTWCAEAAWEPSMLTLAENRQAAGRP